MNGIRAVVVDKQGNVIDYFLASPDNGALSKPDASGNVTLAHEQAMPGDTIIKGAWTRSAKNIADEQAATAQELAIKSAAVSSPE